MAAFALSLTFSAGYHREEYYIWISRMRCIIFSLIKCTFSIIYMGIALDLDSSQKIDITPCRKSDWFCVIQFITKALLQCLNEYSAFVNSCPLQTDTFLFSLIHTHHVLLSSFFSSVMKDWADKYHVWGTPTRSPPRSNSQ